jgi:hypothetical protein
VTASAPGDLRTGEVGPQMRALPPGEGAAPRIKASGVRSITGVRISPGDVSARLVNISWSGALVECEQRFKPGTGVSVHFEGTFQPAQVPSRVARANVSGIGPTGALSYQIGLAFATPITLPDPPSHGEAPAVPSWPAAPAAEYAPSCSALRNRW